MPKFEDLTGQRFGRLVVLGRASNKIRKNGRAKTMWRCKCDCGNEKVINAESLKSGATKSCGCLNAEMRSQVPITHGYTKGGHKERLYGVWRNIISRCEYPKQKVYKYYGGRGISICEEWHNYAVFRDWAYANGYDEKAVRGDCTIDRLDNNGNYEPSNCRWVSLKTQMRNRSDNRLITYNGETKPVVDWAEQMGLSPQTVYCRLNEGWSEADAITIPLLPNNSYGQHYRKERTNLNG